jgi:hypothetical protein
LRDPDGWVRACAAFTVCPNTTEADMVEALATMANSDPEPLARDTARRVLAQHGEADMHTLATVSVMERILFLKGVPLFADLAPPDLKQIAAALHERLYADGDLIAREGEAGAELYVITGGEVRVLAGAEGVEVARRGPGEYVGEMSAISQEPRMATLAAAGEVRLLALDPATFEAILRERPEVGLAVMRELIRRLREK